MIQYFIVIATGIVGLCFGVFGFRLLFQKGFVEKLREGRWKPGKKLKLFSEKEGYMYDKYTRGIGTLILGLMFLAFSVFSIYTLLNK